MVSAGCTSDECVRQTDDRQTDHAVEKCVETGKTACNARATPPNNALYMNMTINQFYSTLPN